MVSFMYHFCKAQSAINNAKAGVISQKVRRESFHFELKVIASCTDEKLTNIQVQHMLLCSEGINRVTRHRHCT